MSRTEKILLFALVLLLLNQKNSQLGTLLGDGTQSYWESQTLVGLF